MKTYKLKHPIQFGSEMITELTFRRPTAGDMMDISANPGMADMIKLASKVSGTEMAKVRMLDIEDTLAVVEIVGGFFPNGQATGGNA